MNYEEIKSKEEEFRSAISAKPKNLPISIGTVLDEEKSVRWNMEEIRKSRELYNKEITKLRKKVDAIYNELYTMYVEYTAETCGVSDDTAKKICEYLEKTDRLSVYGINDISDIFKENER